MTRRVFPRPPRWASGSCRDGHAPDGNELQVLPRYALDFETSLYRFANVEHDLVKNTPEFAEPRVPSSLLNRAQ